MVRYDLFYDPDEDAPTPWIRFNDEPPESEDGDGDSSQNCSNGPSSGGCGGSGSTSSGSGDRTENQDGTGDSEDGENNGRDNNPTSSYDGGDESSEDVPDEGFPGGGGSNSDDQGTSGGSSEDGNDGGSDSGSPSASEDSLPGPQRGIEGLGPLEVFLAKLRGPLRRTGSRGVKPKLSRKISTWFSKAAEPDRRLYAVILDIIEQMTRRKVDRLTQGREKISMWRVIRRILKKTPYKTIYAAKTRSPLALIVDDSGSCGYMLSAFDGICLSCSSIEDVTIYRWPNLGVGFNVYEYGEDRCVAPARYDQETHTYVPSEINPLVDSTMTVLFFGDTDGINVLVNASQTNQNIIWFCTEHRPRMVPEHRGEGWCSYDDFLGTRYNVETPNVDGIIKALKKFRRSDICVNR